MTDELVKTDRRDDGVAVVTLDHPPVNALSGDLLEALAGTAKRLSDDPSLKAVVVTGAGDRAFAAGADISEFGGPAEARDVAARFHAATTALEKIPRPVIAALNGVALGGGLEVAMACDLRVAVDGAKLGQPEILLGIIPGGGGTQRLPQLVGPARAKEIIWSGRQLGAAEALEIGLVDRVVPDALDAALEWASALASGALVAMGLAKRAVDQGVGRTIGEGLEIETDLFAEVFETEDAATGIESFLEHGPGNADFAGR